MTTTDAGLHLPLEGWADFNDVDPPDGRALAVIGTAAVLTDLALRSGVAVLAGTLLVLAVTGGLFATGRIVNRRAWPVIAAAPLFGACLMARQSDWLLPLDVLTTAGLLVLGVTLSRDGDPLDLTVPRLVGRALHALTHGVLAPGFAMASLATRRRGRPSSALLRGVFLALPVVLAIGLLLRSADAVFASFFRVPTDAGSIVLHAVFLGIGAWGAAGLVRVASAEGFRLPVAPRRPLGAVEAMTVLGAMVAVFAAFTATQVVAAVRGDAYVRRTVRLSYAEYARSGFFQLLGVAAISLTVLLVLRATVDASSPAVRQRFVVAAEAAVALTLVVVVVAIRRLALYEQAYGLTMLRFASMLFAVWIGVVFVLVGVAVLRRHDRRQWLVPVAAALAIGGLFALNVVNAEALVVHRNVDRFATNEERFDAAYLSGLSADAVPALLDALPRLAPENAARVREAVCQGERHAPGGVFGFNASRDRAVEARQRACPPSDAGLGG